MITNIFIFIMPLSHYSAQYIGLPLRSTQWTWPYRISYSFSAARTHSCFLLWQFNHSTWTSSCRIEIMRFLRTRKPPNRLLSHGRNYRDSAPILTHDQIFSCPCVAWLNGLIGSIAIKYCQHGLGHAECIGRGALWIPVGKLSMSVKNLNICGEKGL